MVLVYRANIKSETKIPQDLFISQAEEIEEILQRAVYEALLMRKRAGNPIASWKDGKVVIIPPEDILVDDPLKNRSNP